MDPGGGDRLNNGIAEANALTASNFSLLSGGGANGNPLANYLNASTLGGSSSSAHDLALGQQTQAIVNAATAAAVAAGGIPNHLAIGGGSNGYRRPQVNEDMLWMPPHRPLVGGGAAAAYEALRHDFYVRQHADRLQQLQEQQASDLANSSSNGLGNGLQLGNSESSLGASLLSQAGNAITNPRQHFELLKIHHRNLLNEMQETSMMMNMYQQQQQQQQLPPDSLAIAQLLNEQQTANEGSSLNNGNNLATIQRLLQQQQRLPDQRLQDLLPNPSLGAGNEDMAQQIQQLNMLQQRKEELRLRMLLMQQQQGSIEVTESYQDRPPASLLSIQDQQQLNDDEEDECDDDNDSEGNNCDDEGDNCTDDDAEEDEEANDTKIRKRTTNAADNEHGDDEEQRQSNKKQKIEAEV